MNVLTRNPVFSVRFVTERLGEFSVTDTHDSVLSIEVERQMGNAAGGFQISMVPRSIIGSPSGAWWDALTPMDFVEIRIWVPPHKSAWPLFRGFIDTVAMSANYGARGQRTVTIAGRDYGKLLLNTRLFYPTEGIQQVALFEKWQQAYKDVFGDLHGLSPERPPMAENQESDGPNFSPSALQQAIFEKFYQPHEKEILDTFEVAVKPPGIVFIPEAEKDEWEGKLRAYNPAFFQKGMAPWSDLWTMMFSYQHRPWREIFFIEGVSNPALVYRPCPWLSKEGEWIQGAPGETVRTWEIQGEQIVSTLLGRSDAQVLNYFMSFPEQFSFLATMAKTTGDMEGVFSSPLRSNPFLVGFGDLSPTNPSSASLLSRYQRFGFRIGEFPTPYLSMERGLKEDKVKLKMVDVREQGVEGTRRLRLAFDHNHLLEDGQVVIRGDDRMQIGDYVQLANRGGARYYVEGVRQEFRVGTQPGEGHFLTHLQVSRGRGHLAAHYGLPA